MGAAKTTESSRSSMPPWPSIIWPQSFTPRSRLMADITRPPKKPIRFMINDMTAACQGENGVIHHRAVPTSVALNTPPTRPSSVLEGERLGRDLAAAEQLAPDILQHIARLHDDDHEGNEQQLTAFITGMSSVSSAGTCERQNTQIIKPHCSSATRGMNAVVSPRTAATIGSSRKA